MRPIVKDILETLLKEEVDRLENPMPYFSHDEKDLKRIDKDIKELAEKRDKILEMKKLTEERKKLFKEALEDISSQ